MVTNKTRDAITRVKNDHIKYVWVQTGIHITDTAYRNIWLEVSVKSRISRPLSSNTAWLPQFQDFKW